MNLQEQIKQKNGCNPYYANGEMIKETNTDHDHFPYMRHWRGDFTQSEPTVYAREAGWRIQHDDCYKSKQKIVDDPYPNHCFQSSCSNVKQCNPEKCIPMNR